MSKRIAEDIPADNPSLSKVPKLDPAANGSAEGGAAAASKPTTAAGHRDGRLPVLQYKDGEPLRQLSRFQKIAPAQVEVIIPAEYMSSNNKQVKARHLWGDTVYTDDSDLVSVLMHMGYYSNNITHPPQQMSEVHAVLDLLPARDSYPSNFRNNVRSRAWCSKLSTCSYKVRSCWIVTRTGAKIDLKANDSDHAIITPTFCPSSTDRQMNTRSSAGAGARHKTVQEVTVLYNLCNEPWLKYTLAALADRGLKPSQWTSARLREETLFLETSNERFQLAYTGCEAGDEGAEAEERFQWSRCHRALPLAAMKQLGVPLPAGQLQVLQAGLCWEDIHWSNTAVKVKDVSYRIMRVYFMPRCKPHA